MELTWSSLVGVLLHDGTRRRVPQREVLPAEAIDHIEQVRITGPVGTRGVLQELAPKQLAISHHDISIFVYVEVRNYIQFLTDIPPR